MRLLICTYSFFPIIIPRGLHLFELAKAFCREGHELTVYCADSGFQYRELELRFGMRVHPVRPGFWLHRGDVFAGFRAAGAGRQVERGSGMEADSRPEPLPRQRRLLRKLFAWPPVRFLFDGLYPQGTISEFFVTLTPRLLKEKGEYDLVLSVGLPIAVHAAVALALCVRPTLARVALAEYGDPFSHQFQSGLGRWTNAPLERLILRAFDAVVVPTEKARGAYADLIAAEKAHVIPQGVNREDFPVPVFQNRGGPVCFAYAGRFFRGFRDPTPLLAFLHRWPEDFRFTVFTALEDAAVRELLLPWRDRLGARLILRPLLARHACIRELANQDFLIQMDNLRAHQVPGKGIDYALAGRPVFRFRGDNFFPRVLARCLRRDYRDLEPLTDLTGRDARILARRYLELAAIIRGKMTRRKEST